MQGSISISFETEKKGIYRLNYILCYLVMCSIFEHEFYVRIQDFQEIDSTQGWTVTLTTENPPDLTLTNVQTLLVVGFLKILQILKAHKISVLSPY